MSDIAIGTKVRVKDDVFPFGGRIGTVVGFTGLVCPDGVYVALPGAPDFAHLPGVPFDPHEIEVLP